MTIEQLENFRTIITNAYSELNELDKDAGFEILLDIAELRHDNERGCYVDDI